MNFSNHMPILIMYALALVLSIVVIFSSPDSSLDSSNRALTGNSDNYNDNNDGMDALSLNQTSNLHQQAERQYYLPLSTKQEVSLLSSSQSTPSTKQPILITPYVAKKDSKTSEEIEGSNITTNQEAAESDADVGTTSVVVVTKEEYPGKENAHVTTAPIRFIEEGRIGSSSTSVTENEPSIYILKTMATKATAKARNGGIPPTQVVQKLAVPVQQKEDQMMRKSTLNSSNDAPSNRRRLRAQSENEKLTTSSPPPRSSSSSYSTNANPASGFSNRSILGASALFLVVLGRSRSRRWLAKHRHQDGLIWGRPPFGYGGRYYHEESDEETEDDGDDVFGFLENELSLGIGYACDSSTESGYGSFESSSSSSWSGDLLDKFDL